MLVHAVHVQQAPLEKEMTFGNGKCYIMPNTECASHDCCHLCVWIWHYSGEQITVLLCAVIFSCLLCFKGSCEVATIENCCIQASLQVIHLQAVVE